MRQEASVRGPRRSSGVTLIELMVVLALMAVLMGLGVSMYTNLGKQGVFTATVARVLSTLNRVRNSSMTHPAALQVNAGDIDKGEENSIRGVEYVNMFSSQCEPTEEGVLQGALDRNGSLPPTASFREGIIGRALFLDGGAVDCGDYPAMDATEGVSVDLWVYPTGLTGGTLVRRGEGLGLSLTRQVEGMGIRLELGFRSPPPAAAAGAAPGAGSSATSASDPTESRTFDVRGVSVPANRWTRIIATYDKSKVEKNVQVFVDLGRGPVERFSQREKNPLAPSRKSHLYLGGGGGDGAAFRGGIDDLRIEGILGEAFEPFPAQVKVLGPSRKVFFAGGKLDQTHHSLAETIVIQYGRREKTILIGLEGNIVNK